MLGTSRHHDAAVGSLKTTKAGMGRRYSSTSPPPLAALAAVVLILLIACSSHRGAAARPLPAVLRHHAENGVKDAADGLVVVQEGAAAGNGGQVSVSEVRTTMVGRAEARGEVEEEATTECEEGKNDDLECVQRRLLQDAHLDYIYTQHKGKP